MALLKVSTPFNIDLDFNVASVVKRSIAYLLDIGIAMVYVLVLQLTIFDQQVEIEQLFQAAYLFLLIIPLYSYHFLSEVFMKGQSLGKKIMGIRVVDANGNAASTSQLFLRWILSMPNMIFPFLCYYIWYSPYVIMILAVVALPDVIAMSANSSGKRIGDIAANTAVVSTKNVLHIDQTIFKEVSLETGYTAKYPEVMRLTDKDINSLKDLTQKKRTRDLDDYSDRVASRIEEVLSINNQSGDAYSFFEELLTDYNYFTLKN